MWNLAPDQVSYLGPLHWEHEVLDTDHWGSPQIVFYKEITIWNNIVIQGKFAEELELIVLSLPYMGASVSNNP